MESIGYLLLLGMFFSHDILKKISLYYTVMLSIKNRIILYILESILIIVAFYLIDGHFNMMASSFFITLVISVTEAKAMYMDKK
jgi:hypothetical protein